MARITLDLKGGAKLRKTLDRIAAKLGDGGSVSVGFFPKATYPTQEGSLPVAQVALLNEWGTSRIPARPFFRNMLAVESPQWGQRLAEVAKSTDYDTKKTLGLMGEGIRGQLRESIVRFSDPPNADATVAKKGFNKPLVDTGVMLRAVDYEVKTT